MLSNSIACHQEITCERKSQSNFRCYLMLEIALTAVLTFSNHHPWSESMAINIRPSVHKKMTICWRSRWLLAIFLANKVFFNQDMELCLWHVIVHLIDYNIVKINFLCTEKPQNSCDFIVILALLLWSETKSTVSWGLTVQYMNVSGSNPLYFEIYIQCYMFQYISINETEK